MSTSSTAPITVKENGVSSAKDTILLVIGAAEPIPWPPRLPDFTLCDFYSWRYAEDQVHQPPMPQSLRERISHSQRR